MPTLNLKKKLGKEDLMKMYTVELTRGIYGIYRRV